MLSECDQRNPCRVTEFLETFSALFGDCFVYPFVAARNEYRISQDRIDITARVRDGDCTIRVIQTDGPAFRRRIKHIGDGRKMSDVAILWVECARAGIRVALVEFKKSIDEVQIRRGFEQVRQMKEKLHSYLADAELNSYKIGCYVLVPKRAPDLGRMPTDVQLIRMERTESFSEDLRAMVEGSGTLTGRRRA